MGELKKILLVIPVLCVACLNQPTQAYAWFFGWGWGDHRERHGYDEVLVSGDRYYYNDGVFYTGAPGSYVVVGAPIGAVVYNVPPDCGRVDIDGMVYFSCHDAYYRPEGRGYRVVERPRRHEEEHRHDGEERREHREEHRE